MLSLGSFKTGAILLVSVLVLFITWESLVTTNILPFVFRGLLYLSIIALDCSSFHVRMVLLCVGMSLCTILLSCLTT